MIKEFREFILRGNVVDLAVAVVIGAAFGAVVAAFVADLVTPLIAAIGGKPDFADLHVHDQRVDVPATAHFLNAVISFLIIARGDLLLRRQAAEHAGGATQGEEAPEPEAPAEDVRLLTEIRDLLAQAQHAVAADVAVLAADAHVRRLGAVGGVAQAAHRRRVHARQAAGTERPLLAAEVELDLALEHQVQLLLALVVVRVGRVAGRQHDRVDAERRHAQRVADLAEAGARAQPVDAADRPAAAVFGVHRRAY